MAEIYRALVDMEVYGFIEQGDQNLHEIVLYEGETYNIELEAEDEDTSLDLYITDEDDKVVSQVTVPAAELTLSFTPEKDAVFSFFVKAVEGAADYVLKITEQD